MKNYEGFFENENDKTMYEMLFMLKNGTKDDFIKWLELHPVPDEYKLKVKDKDEHQSRAERTTAIIEYITRIETYINQKYFIGTDSGGNN